MSKAWNYVLTSKVNEFWFALSCVLLLSLSFVIKSETDRIVRPIDDTIEQLRHPMPPQLMPGAMRPAKAMPPATS